MAKGIYYSGDVFFRRYNDDGTLSNDIIEVAGVKFAVKPNNEIKRRYGKGRTDRGKLKGSSAQAKPTEISIGFNEVDSNMLAILFLGTTSAVNIAGGSVSGESITLVLNQWVKTAQRNISASAIATFVLGTDFKEHNRMGAIMALTQGIVGVQSLSYTHGAIDCNRIPAGSKSRIDVEVVFDGINEEDQTDAYIRVPKLTLQANSEVDLLPDDYVTAEMSGEAEKLDSEPADVIFDDSVVYS